MLSAKEAAEYCGLRPQRFPVDCCVTPIVMPNGAKLYDMRDLDTWIDDIKSGLPNGDDDIVARLRR